MYQQVSSTFNPHRYTISRYYYPHFTDGQTEIQRGEVQDHINSNYFNTCLSDCFFFLAASQITTNLKQHPFVIHSLCRLEVQAQFSCILCSGSHEAEIKMSARTSISWGLGSSSKLYGIVGRIQCVMVIGPRPSAPVAAHCLLPCGPLPDTAD